MPDDRPDSRTAAFIGECLRCDENRRFIDLCLAVYRMLEDYNRHTNVTRITGIDEFWRKHVADSLAITMFFPELLDGEYCLADIGCGAGFPSLILAAACPRLRINAIDSVGKKTAFVRAAAETLGFSELTVTTARSREMMRRQEWHGVFDIITARAVTDARTLLRENRPMLNRNGKFIFYKTPSQLREELPQVVSASKKYGIGWNVTPAFELPGDGGTRQFLFSSSL